MHNFNRDVFLYDTSVEHDNAVRIEAVDYVRNVMLINMKVSCIEVAMGFVHTWQFISPKSELKLWSISSVACWTLNRWNTASNQICCRFGHWAFSFSPRRPSSLSCVNEYMAIDSGGHVNVFAQ